MSGPTEAVNASRQLLDALLAGRVFGGTDSPEVIETHVSWVILTGELAYKIKKPVNLGFLDFTSVESRRQACMEELRLNRRLTPDIYLDVIAIRGDLRQPHLGDNGPVIEYAVKMRQFPRDAVLASGVAGVLEVTELEKLADLIAQFHESVPRGGVAECWGDPALIWEPVRSSLQQLAGLLSATVDPALLNRVRDFLEQEFREQSGLMEQRRRAGYVRECHGDLHLGNLVRLNGRIVPFDALEFDPALRWIDVLNEVAFLVMDLEIHSNGHQGYRFLNRYLEIGGDYAGLPVLPFFLSYRALVRAKVIALSPGGDSEVTRRRVDTLLGYAAEPRPPLGPLLVLVAGLSGSGKSYLARQIAAALPAIHLRSDIERKRLLGLQPLQRTDSPVAGGIYRADVSERTYDRLNQLAGTILRSRLAVIVDATNLRQQDRSRFLATARCLGVKTAILLCKSDPATITARVERRQAEAGDPSEATLEVVARQRELFEPPQPDEADLLAEIDTNTGDCLSSSLNQLRSLRPVRGGPTWPGRDARN